MISNLELISHKQNINFGSRNSRASKTKTNNPKRSKQVVAYKNGELVMTFLSTAEAGRQAFNQSAVSAFCRGKLTHYKGYEWRNI